MTITNLVNARPATTDLSPFRFAAGAPSLSRVYSRSELLGFEEMLVAALRGYTTAVARRCHRTSPFVYADRVAQLTKPDGSDSPNVWSSRLQTLLHVYADYVPSNECEFVDSFSEEYQCWENADGDVVIDVVTTLTMTELAPGESEHKVHDATRKGSLCFGDQFLGVRHIVLDAPYEGSWCPASGDPQPLHACSIDGAFFADIDAADFVDGYLNAEDFDAEAGERA